MTTNETVPDRTFTVAGDLGDVAGAISRVIATLHEQQAELANLHDAVALIDGRTQRHDVDEQTAQATRRDTAELAERVEQEASLRRDLTAVVERQSGREQAERAVLARELEQVLVSLNALREQADAAEQGSARAVAGTAERDRRERSVDDQIAALEQRLAASEAEMRGIRDEQARATPGLARLDASIASLDDRARVAEEGRVQLEQDVAALRAAGDREHELLEVVEQQRATRLRMEERIALFEAALNDVRNELGEAAEERSILRQQIAGSRQRLQEMVGALEQQQETIVEHFRRWTAASGAAGRREVEEIERTNRVARDLLMRLTEAADSAVADALVEPGHSEPALSEPAPFGPVEGQPLPGTTPPGAAPGTPPGTAGPSSSPE
jgi:chromosome segregation ATPase